MLPRNAPPSGRARPIERERSGLDERPTRRSRPRWLPWSERRPTPNVRASTFERTEKLWNEKLIARQEYDTRQSALAAAEAAVKEAEARIDQEKARRQQIAAQLNAQQRRVSQVQANLRRASDVLDKYNVYSPIDGVVTNLPVRVGETVVPGIQNSPASTIMTVADMSLITAEVKVDETDIVNVKLGQTADITIDAMPNRTFKGRVIEIGNTAILRSTGVAARKAPSPARKRKISRW